MNKKIIMLFVFVVAISGIFLVSSFGDDDKVSDEVYDALEENEEVRVVVELREVEDVRGFFIKISKSDEEIGAEERKVKEDIIEEIGVENVKHIFDKTIALEVNEKDLDDLKRNDNVESVVIDKPIKAFLQSSVPLINASVVWPVNLSGQNITGVDETVCIIDTGIDFTHPALIGKNKTCVVDCITNVNCVVDCSVGDDNGHGTHVAGIVAASGTINGVATGANLIGVKVLDSTGGGSVSDAKAGIEWCVQNAETYNISVISMSLGITDAGGSEVPYADYCDSEYDGVGGGEINLVTPINNATLNNISVVIATGNNLGTTGITAPACIQNSTAIGTIGKDDSTFAHNRNNLVDFIAPGLSINSTMVLSPGSAYLISTCETGNRYCSLDGTSMATPHVAGAFALYRQFFRLQNGRIPTPVEIESVFNSMGKQINDSCIGGTNLNYSRVDVFAAIQFIDVSNPVVTLSSPVNGTVQFTQNVTFGCSANDVQLDNITLYVWNSSDLFNDSVVADVGGANGVLSEEIVNMSFGDYEWNCLAYDENGNYSFASSNYSLTIRQMISSLNVPVNNSFVNVNQTYNCSAETEPTKELSNLTFYAWNSSGDLVYNLTEDIGGAANSSLFYFNFTTEQEYSWNCLGYNNESESDWGNSNFTITYDATNPDLVITSSPESATSNPVVRSFGFNVSDSNLANCSLIVNGDIGLTNFSMNSSVGQTFSETFVPRTYVWNIDCSDLAGNVNSSSENSFVITAPVVASSSSGGGGGGSSYSSSSVSKIYEVSIAEVRSGYTRKLKKDDGVNFSIFDFEGGRHSLSVDGVGDDYVELTINPIRNKSNGTGSEPVGLKLGVGQSARLNLTSPNYYDLFIGLNSVVGSEAELTIRLINEPVEISVVKITGDVVVAEVEVVGDYLLIVIVLVLVLVGIVFVVLKKGVRKRKSGKKGRRERNAD